MSGVGPFPVKRPRPLRQWSIFKFAIIKTDNWHNFAHIACREDFIRFAEIFDLQSGFMDGDACCAQKPDYALASNAGEECTIGRWRENLATTYHEDV